VFWSVFWQRCINEKVLKLKDFEESARDRYKLKELQSDVTLADELKNAMKAMKNKSKGTQSVTASGAKATEGTAPRDSERPVSRRGTVSLKSKGSILRLTLVIDAGFGREIISSSERTLQNPWREQKKLESPFIGQ
jgi:hypothetical protein